MRTRTRGLLLCTIVVTSTASSVVFGAAPTHDFTVDVESRAAQSLIVSNGQSVLLRVAKPSMKKVKAPPAGVPRIQWAKDNDLVPGQTNATFDIPNASFSDVGSYSVWINGPDKSRQESAPIHLSVYSLFYTNSNGGSLGIPIGQFTSGNNTVCGGTGFDRYKVYFPFYGPNAANQTGLFVNNSSSANLDVTTCTNVNGAIDTAIRIQENWAPMTTKDCNDDDTNCVVYSKLSTAKATNLSTNSTTNNTYRTTIYFNNATLGTNTSVTFRWYYHN